MAPDDPSGGRPAAPIVLRIKLRYDDLDAMVQRFAANVGKSGLFLPTRSMQPIGAEVKFELRLADDTPALVGLGRVKAVKPPDPHNARAAFGIAVELMRVTPQSRVLILRMLERRRELGLPEVGLPTAADIDAARRAEPGDTAGRDLVTGPVAPVGEGLLTAPRRTTGPFAVAKVAAIAPLPPEPPRRSRAAVSEIIERASEPVAGLAAAVPGFDDDVDIAAAIARARALAGGGLDAELEALCEAAAAPLEISIEAASAELARQLGGSAVRRDRSAGWAPPPATSAEPPGDAGSASDPTSPPNGAAGTAAPVAEAPALVAAAVEEADAVPAAAAPGEAGEPAVAAMPSTEAAPVAAMPGSDTPDDEDDRGVHARSFGPPHAERIRTEPSAPVAVLPLADQARAGLALADLDGDERTEMGDMPVAAGGFELPADADEIAAGTAEPAAGLAPAVEPPLELGVDELDDFEIIAEADAADEDLLASHGEHDASSRRELPARPPTGERRPSELDFAARLDLGDDSDLYLGAPADEFSARHVIGGLQDELTGQHGAPRDPRLAGAALPDPYAISAGAALAAFETGDDSYDDDAEVTDDPDAYAQPGVEPIFDPDSSSSFTLAGIPSDSIDLDPPPPPRSEPIDPPRPAPRPPAALRPEPRIEPRAAPPVHRNNPLSLHEAPVEDFELERALEALDVDLDRSIQRAAPPLQRDRSRPTPAPSRAAAPTPSRAVRPIGLGAPGSGRIAAPRAPSESVDINLDDDD